MKKVILPLVIAVFAAIPSISFAQSNEVLIKNYISQNKLREYKKSDLNQFVIDNVDSSKSLSSDVVKIQQTYNGLPVYGTVATVLVKNNTVTYFNDNFIKDYKSTGSATASLSKKAALDKIAADLGKNEISDLPLLDFFQQGQNKHVAAKQRLVYSSDEKGNLKLAYEFLVHEPKTSNHWNYVIDANSGEVISKLNLNLSCNFHEDAYSHESQAVALPQNKEYYPDNNNSLLLSADNASYNVFALPVEAPTFAARSLITNPWILTSSPEGWHSNGVTHYTITRGNNAYAYDDKDDDEATFGSSPDGGATRNFNFPYDPNTKAINNLSAATTNLFYISNMMHDVFYKFGFTEAARNFQSNNFGNGGLDDDEVFAQSQDGGGYNNANFASYPDNYNPVMQMYLWIGSNRVLFYNAPTDATSRVVNGGVAQFGQPLDDMGITGDVKLASVIDGCTALPAGELAGKIGLIERGGVSTCTFASKVKNAQNAGATGVIIYNNVANGSTLGNMGGTDATVTIPSILITNSEGEYIKAKLAANTPVNVDLRLDAKYDGSFDNGIVSHEYGHGISNRLTGTGYNCLNSGSSKEQMGEGWSDFFALMLTNKPGDNASVARGIGTYASGQGITGSGIRPAKYSPDFAVNDYTYTDTNGMEYNNGQGIVPDVHSIGFVWATMLWDLNWEYVAKYGYASNVTSSTTSGSARVLQLVTDALKLQACNPTFVDGRNAILQAEMATTGGADKCMIWRTFAKRGLGVNASAGSKTSINDQTQDFTVPAECVLSTSETSAVKNVGVSIYPNPAKNEFYINFPSSTLGKVDVEIYDMSGKLISTENKISPEAKKAISTSKLINGTYLVKVKGLGIDTTSKVIINK
ncbi:T9SS-dependent M36 family metallopeptidase [Chryseobacterium indoltheticum]|uniref:Por secretion system C-terminal sorting domain-containing protein n=1 Tax=Chryseobacterium indoltheticum TaxID=254 RepID=A0A381FCD2_9FLAO|nr:T9SS-dependent M36 family metallopeptidase [Chryseobacterium indoltheticum]SIR20099.1 Por secretion system C-terminal sorting domain-containing protein [Chryseobacterium indoltheticum]SUX44225.1 Stearolysin precursor [Chryseobacterium indoltheticum]